MIGFGVALARRSSYPLLSGATYVWFFRTIPTLLIFLVVWNVGPQLFPVLHKDRFNPFLACWIGMPTVEAAYMAEIYPPAISSVDAGPEIAAPDVLAKTAGQLKIVPHAYAPENPIKQLGGKSPRCWA